MKKLFIVLLLSCVNFVSRAQTTSGYTFTASSGTYSSIASTSTALASISGDDMFASSISIGFTFNYGGVAYTQLYASSNGYIALPNFLPSSGAPSANNSTSSLSLLNFGKGILCPFWDDLDCSGRAVYSQTSGTTPNRVFTIEWNNAGYYAGMSGASADSLNFQVKLYETSGTIEFCYGRGVLAAGTASATIGIVDSTTDYVTLNNTTSSPVSSASFTNTLASFPANGQIYRYSLCTPSSSSTSQSGCRSAVINGSTYDSTGTYFQHFTSSSGCDSILTIYLTITSIDTTVSVSSSTLTSNQAGATYQWLDCDHGTTAVAGATNQTFSPATTGHYAVKITSGMCSDTSACKAIMPNSVKNHEISTPTLSPNPASHTLEFNSTNCGLTFNITDLCGRALIHGTTVQSTTQVDISQLSSGVYLLNIKGLPPIRWVKE